MLSSRSLGARGDSRGRREQQQQQYAASIDHDENEMQQRQQGRRGAASVLAAAAKTVEDRPGSFLAPGDEDGAGGDSGGGESDGVATQGLTLGPLPSFPTKASQSSGSNNDASLLSSSSVFPSSSASPFPPPAAAKSRAVGLGPSATTLTSSFRTGSSSPAPIASSSSVLPESIGLDNENAAELRPFQTEENDDSATTDPIYGYYTDDGTDYEETGYGGEDREGMGVDREPPSYFQVMLLML